MRPTGAVRRLAGSSGRRHPIDLPEGGYHTQSHKPRTLSCGRRKACPPAPARDRAPGRSASGLRPVRRSRTTSEQDHRHPSGRAATPRTRPATPPAHPAAAKVCTLTIVNASPSRHQPKPPSRRSPPWGGGGHRRVPFPEGSSQFPSRFRSVRTLARVSAVTLTSDYGDSCTRLNWLPDG